MSAAITAQELKRRLHGRGELALIDIREPGESGEGRPLLAVNIPYSTLELQAATLIPSTACCVVLMDDGEDDWRAALAARRLEGMGYTDVHTLSGGLSAWASAGYSVFKGVNVPCKTFGELLEHARHTPSISAEELAELKNSARPPVILDGRTPDEHKRMSIPGGISCPNGELGLRFEHLSEPDDLLVVNCAGRTRSIVGAQTLIDLGIANRVVALRNGTMGWRLAGYELAHDTGLTHPLEMDDVALARAQARARSLAAQDGIETVSAATVDAWLDADERSVYLLDVRTAEEYAQGHQPGAVHAPGGQLVQASDQWIAARGARVVLIDDELVRSILSARWLKCMGHEVFALAPGEALRTREAPVAAPALPALRSLRPEALPAGAALVDLRSSASFAEAHIAGAIWSIRPRVAAAAQGLGEVALVVESAGVAALAALDLQEAGVSVAGWIADDAAGWRAAGLEVVSGDAVPDAERIDFLFFVHDRHQGNMDAAREYLAWETGLIDQLDDQERELFAL